MDSLESYLAARSSTMEYSTERRRGVKKNREMLAAAEKAREALLALEPGMLCKLAGRGVQLGKAPNHLSAGPYQKDVKLGSSFRAVPKRSVIHFILVPG